MDNSESKSNRGQDNGSIPAYSGSQSNSSNTKRKLKYLESFLCTPELFDDPYTGSKNATYDIFHSSSIKNLKKRPGYFQIEFNDKMGKDEQDEQRNFQAQTIEDPELKKQLFKGQEGLKRLMPRFLQKAETRQQREKSLDMYKKILKQKVEAAKNKSGAQAFIVFYYPINKVSTVAKYISLSDGMVKLLGYTESQFFIQGCQNGFQSLEIYSGTTYVEVFLNFMNTFRKYVAKELFDDAEYQDIFEESQMTIENEMKGNKIIRVQMKVNLPHYEIGYNQIVSVIDEKVNDLKKAKNVLKLESYENNLHLAYKSLHKFVKLPGFMIPSNLSKICSFKEIVPEAKSYIMPQNCQQNTQNQQNQEKMNKSQAWAKTNDS